MIGPISSCIAQEYTEILSAVEPLDEKGSLEQLLMSTYSTDHKRLSTSLHHIFLAWWRLRTEMVPQVSGRLLGVLQTLLSDGMYSRMSSSLERRSREISSEHCYSSRCQQIHLRLPAKQDEY